MKLLKGKSLVDKIYERGPLEWREAVNILFQVCDSLEEAHDKGILHRDLKPENIFLTDLGTEKEFVKVIDFGLAKFLDKKLAIHL